MSDAQHRDVQRADDAASQARNGSPVRPRAIQLLSRILESGDAEAADVADALLVSVETISAYRRGTIPMPLECQLLLATFAIESTPGQARLGHRLRGQVRAAIALAGHETPTHLTPPRSSRW